MNNVAIYNDLCGSLLFGLDEMGSGSPPVCFWLFTVLLAIQKKETRIELGYIYYCVLAGLAQHISLHTEQLLATSDGLDELGIV